MNRLQWHHFYFLIALLGVVSIFIGLSFSHELRKEFEFTLQTNQQLSQLLAKIDQLPKIAHQVNAPGNDVFSSNDSQKESIRLNTAVRQFQIQKQRIENDLSSNTPLSLRNSIPLSLIKIDGKMNEMLQESKIVLETISKVEKNPALLNRDIRKAAQSMAVMDQKLGTLLQAIRDLRLLVQSAQEQAFEVQKERMRSLQTSEMAIALLVFVMLSGVTYYGIKLSRFILEVKEKEQSAQNEIGRQRSLLIESAKLNSLGQMAGGIAHEINNPLAIISGKAVRALELLESENFEKSKIQEDLIKIDSLVFRISKIIRGLKAFSRNADHDPFKPVNLEGLMNDCLSLCQEKFKNHDVDLKVDPVPNIEIECRGTQISQILINLLNNSYDAIQREGTKWIHLSARIEKEQVYFTISDSGQRIDPQVASKMMEPFFTTKEVGKGTGLGLSISMGIAQMHGGILRHLPDSPHTTFELSIPIKQLSKESTSKAA